VHAIYTLALHALRAPQRGNSLRSAPWAAAASIPASAAAESAARSTAWCASTWGAGSAKSGGSGLSRNGIVTVSESAACVWAAGLRESTRWGLAHCNCADHLNRVRGGGLTELPARLRIILVFGADFGGILILAV
jgi:hypothetical protein